MKIKVPNEIQIGCHKHKVFLKDNTTSDYDGDAYHLAEMIRVDETLPPTQRGATFIHESLHLICRIYSVTLAERDINALAEGLGQLLFADLGIELDWSDIPTMTATIKKKEGK